MLSRRTSWDLTEDDLAVAIRAARSQGRDLLDLTVANPTAAGLQVSAESLLPLGDPAALLYDPSPLGMLSARQAVSDYYRDHAATVELDRICLATSTSEAYSFLFRLLCDPGDEVLVARPSYPLFDYIAALADVDLREYPLLYDPNADAAHSQGWFLDLHSLQAAITPRTRAVILVHPNNPTGNLVSASERAALQTLCAERHLALIVDEVFLDYALTPAQPRTFAAGAGCLTFVLSGISKVCALPQMKLSWIAASGPEPLVAAAMERLEVIADTFLSVNAPVQLALPGWLAQRHHLQQRILHRLRANLALLEQHLCGSATQRLSLQAGWTTILRMPRIAAGRGLAHAALDRGVIVQPGEFFGLAGDRIVLSLLTPPEIWSRGLEALGL